MTDSIFRSMAALEDLALKFVPRILTQISRDPTSLSYGCCDRNWWHYKIRDYPSVILQQAGYAIYLASLPPLFDQKFADREELVRLAAASCKFWNFRACLRGAFEEYYPWEQGYPPLAFSTLAVVKMVDAGVVSFQSVRDGVSRAARQLAARFEPEAANQQVAGLAAMAYIRKISCGLLSERSFRQLRDRTLALQDEEGWFREYGGPDLGYLSVTLDCLWDLYDATGDPDYLRSAEKALEFLASFVELPSRGAGMHNARNTDYMVPYGIGRFALDPGFDTGRKAQSVLGRIFYGLNRASHFIHGLDDRYLCHYIGHSFLRTALLLKQLEKRSFQTSESPTANSAREVFFPNSGHYLKSSTDSRSAAVLISCRKGGIVSAWCGSSEIHDFGWQISLGKRLYTSHWWADFWKYEHFGNTAVISGYLTPHKEVVSNPVEHVLLRLGSFLVGCRLISFLKETLIFKERQRRTLQFTRKITWEARRISLEDTFRNLSPEMVPERATRLSRRHVASADWFHRQDLALCENCRKIQKSIRRKDALIVTTRYILSPE